MSAQPEPLLLSEVMDLFGLEYERACLLPREAVPGDPSARVAGEVVVRMAGELGATVERSECRWCGDDFWWLRRSSGGRNPLYCGVPCRRADAEWRRASRKRVDKAEHSVLPCV